MTPDSVSIERVKHAWREGDSATILGERTGTTKSAILGLYYRHAELKQSHPLAGTLPVAANDNKLARERPKAFDDAVVAYLPALKAMCKKWYAQEAEQVYANTLIRVFSAWESYRHETYERGTGFRRWLFWQMRSCINDIKMHKKTLKYGEECLMPYDKIEKVNWRDVDLGAKQHRSLEAMDIIERISSDREGRILMRRAMGDSLQDIATEQGVSRERIRQLEERARGKLDKYRKLAA